MMHTIYVAGYPKSGTTWLTRLLGDALDCPTGGSLPADDAIEPASEGWERPGPYWVRKGHFMLVEDGTRGPVPRSHALAYRALTDEGVVYIQRDTRDVICSTRHYWDMPSIEATIMNMVRGAITRAYVPYMRSWLEATFPCIRTSYEALWADTKGEVARILSELGLDVNEERLPEVVERQSFAARKAHAEQHGDSLILGKEYHVRFYRRGTPGSWRDTFSDGDVQLAEHHFGDVMRQLGYLPERDR